MQIKNAKFVISSPDIESVPKSDLPEFAFIGRSNVGKSSLINMLTEKKSLAKTSSTPGKTQLINHFLINDNWHLVDLPGYGYAKVSKKKRKSFGKMIEGYLRESPNLSVLFVLIDSRHKPQKIDLEFIQQLGEWGVPYAVVFTKSDKLKQKEVQKNIRMFKQELLKDWEELPPIFISSAVKRHGRNQILSFLDDVLDEIK